MAGKSMNELQQITSQVRRDIIRMTHAVASGHPGGSLGCADFVTSLYYNILDCSTDFDMNGKGKSSFYVQRKLFDG